MTRIAFPRMADLLPPKVHGRATIDHYTVSEQEAKLGNLRASFHPGGHLDHVEPGCYARLLVGGQLVMTDTQMEQRTNFTVTYKATGRVLVAGLGLGMILHPILAKPDVQHVTVLEISTDVVNLVAPSLSHYGERLLIVAADALTWQPPRGAKWDTIYFDIWPTICEDNLTDAARLSRHYARRLNRENPKAWMGGWRIDELRARRDSDRRNGW